MQNFSVINKPQPQVQKFGLRMHKHGDTNRMSDRNCTDSTKATAAKLMLSSVKGS